MASYLFVLFDRVVVGDHSAEGIGFHHFGGKPRGVGEGRQIADFAFLFSVSRICMISRVGPNLGPL